MALKPSVLVVDDEPNIVVSLEFLMKQAGYDVRVARDGEEALKAEVESLSDGFLAAIASSGLAISPAGD